MDVHLICSSVDDDDDDDDGMKNECEVTKKATMFQHSHVFHVALMQGQWLRNQLPIRFARRLDEFLQLPYHGR